MKDYIIRKANIDDKIVIAQIYVNSWKFAYKDIVPQDYLDSLSVEEYMERLKDKIELDEFLLELDGAVIGLAKIIECRDDDLCSGAEIQTIYFMPEFIGRGYGNLLLKWLIEYAGLVGYKNIVVWVLTENKRARKAYERVGFQKDKVKLVTIGGKELRETRYSLCL